MTQQLNQLLYPRTLRTFESLVTDYLNKKYNTLPQSWGERNLVAKAGEVSYTDANHSARLFGERISCGPSMKKICDRFTFLALENHIDQPSVVFSVGEPDRGVQVPWIKVTKAKFQTDEEKALPILKFSAVRVDRGAPLIRNLRQAQGSGLQLGQVV